jgi:prepilin-type N-terminal cleavage/methylation domain-containing protein
MRRLSAFTLIEVAIVLVIIGVLSAAVFKGHDVLEAAKIRATAQDFQRYQLAITAYQDQFNALPGDDNQASTRFGADVSNGDGNYRIDVAEADLVWLHLFKAGFVSQGGAPSAKVGGVFTVMYNPDAALPGHWLKLSNPEGRSLLTPKQAQQLKAKFEEGSLKPTEGALRIANGPEGTCLNDGGYAPTTAPACVAYFKIN